MKADLDKIKWLMENQSIYSISKATGISQTTLGPYNLGQRDFGNMTLRNASKNDRENITNKELAELKKACKQL